MQTSDSILHLKIKLTWNGSCEAVVVVVVLVKDEINLKRQVWSCSSSSGTCNVKDELTLKYKFANLHRQVAPDTLN